jgi:hypothetical protein
LYVEYGVIVLSIRFTQYSDLPVDEG